LQKRIEYLIRYLPFGFAPRPKEQAGVARKKQSNRLGSSLSDYLKSEGSYDETSAVAVKRVLAWQLE
jgi:hypothetical protein